MLQNKISLMWIWLECGGRGIISDEKINKRKHQTPLSHTRGGWGTCRNRSFKERLYELSGGKDAWLDKTLGNSNLFSKFTHKPNGINIQVVIRRPYILLFRDEKDLVRWFALFKHNDPINGSESNIDRSSNVQVIRGLVNLAIAKIEYSEDQQELLKAPNTFSVCTSHRTFLVFRNTLVNLKNRNVFEMQPLPDDDVRSYVKINPFLLFS